MYIDELNTSWDELKGKVKNHWNKLTDDDIDEISGDMNRLVAHISSVYEKNKGEVISDVKKFLYNSQINKTMKQVGNSIADTAEKVKENVQQYSAQITDTVKENPIKSALIVGVVSLVIGYLLNHK